MSMKQLIHNFTIFMMVVMQVVINYSCSSDNGDEKTIPEVTVPAGSENFFIKAINFDAVSSQQTVTFNTNVSWQLTVADSRGGDEWCTVSPSSGNAGTYVVTIRATENTSDEDRNAVIFLLTGDVINKIYVNQKHMDALTFTANRFEVPVAGGTVDIEVKTNLDFDVEIPNRYKGWIHIKNSNTRAVASHHVSLTIDKSEEYDKREGEVVFRANGKEESVKIFQAGEGIITISKNEYDLSSSEQTLAIEISSNFNYAVDMPNVDWLSEDLSQTRGVSTHTLKLKIKENDDYDTRNATIRVYDKNSSIEESIRISQASKGALLTIPKKVYDLTSEKQTLEIEINSNFDYAVDMPNVDWIKESATGTRGIKKSTLKLDILENQNYEDRSARIRVYEKKGNKEEYVTINQATKGGVLVISKKEFDISSAKQTVLVEINSNFDYSVDLSDAPWIRRNSATTRAMSTHTLSLEVAENTSYSSRTGKVRVYDNNSSVSQTITINQAANEVILIETKKYSIDENGGTFTVEVKSNVDYEVKNDNDWISEVKTATRALEKRTHTFKVSPIVDGKDRNAVITFRNTTKGLSESITVNQTSDLFFETTSITLMNGDQKKLSLTNKTNQEVKWSSSDTSVASVDNTGNITAVGKGKATITARTSDGKHSCTCEVVVSDISDMISASSIGGAISSINGLIQYGSKLNWRFSNSSSSDVTLKSLQLIDGETGKEGNIMNVDTVVSAGNSVSYTTTIGLAGIHAPVTCRFRYEYNGKEYIADATYVNSSWGW